MTDSERVDLLDALTKHRTLMLQTVRGISDEQAARQTTVSTLCLGGLIKHLTRMEERWTGFIEHGPDAMAISPQSHAAHVSSFQMQPDERLAPIVDRYEEVARRTDDLVTRLPSLDTSHPLPAAPWFPSDTTWSARRVFMHILAETAQHAGHADIIRESLDGTKTMG